MRKEKWVSTLQKITNILNDFLAPFECVAEVGTDFSYYLASNTINYTLIVSEIHINTFTTFVNNLFPTIHADPFLWSVLHELGHHETEDDFEDDEWKEYDDIVSNWDSFNQKDEEYYNLPIEYAATSWAGNYMITHTKEVKELWNKIKPLIAQFYEEMEVDR